MKRIYLLFFVSVVTGCTSTTTNQPGQPSFKAEDSVATDTVIAPFPMISREEDSLRAIQERDSFYRVRPLKQFITDSEGDGTNKLTASFIDTSMLTLSAVNVRDTEIVKYNKEELPVAKKYIYRYRDLAIQLNDDCYDYCPRKIFINNKRMRPGIDLDTSISGEWEWFVTNIVLDKEKFYNARIGNRSFFLAGGHVEKCNGMACGINYFLLYDLQNKKAIVYQQFRSEEFRAGFNTKTGEVEILVTDDGDYNDRFNCVFYSGRVFRITKNGMVKEATNDAGKPLYYKGYRSMYGVDTTNIIEGNFRN